LPSICENRSLSASDGSVGAAFVAPDWLCASISALMVCGAIDGPVGSAEQPVEAWDCVPPPRSNGLVAPWLCFVELVAADDFEDDNDCRASIRDPAAPSANIMKVTPTQAAGCAVRHHSPEVSKCRAMIKSPIKQGVRHIAAGRASRQ